MAFSLLHPNSNVNIDRMKLSETSMKLGFPLLLQHMETLFYIYIRGMQFFDRDTIYQFFDSKLIHIF